MAQTIMPETGQKIYLPEKNFFNSDLPNYTGGIATIRAFKKPHSKSTGLLISVEEEPGHWYSWDYVMRNQERWELTYRSSVYSPR